MIKLNIGLRVATVDFGGWDTHNNQGNSGEGYFAGQAQTLALAAFYTDLDGSGAQNYNQRLTTVVMSEFGRRLRENADRGSDHGHGNFMMVMGVMPSVEFMAPGQGCPTSSFFKAPISR